MNENMKDNLELAKKYIKETSIPNLHILTNGTIPQNPSELLASDNMKELVKLLKNTYDIVIVDAPPSKIVTDSTILSTIVDSTVLVINSTKTSINDLRDVKKSIELVGGDIIGAIVNKVKMTEHKYSNHYYYGNSKQNENNNYKFEEKSTISVEDLVNQTIINLENEATYNISENENIEQEIHIIDENNLVNSQLEIINANYNKLNNKIDSISNKSVYDKEIKHIIKEEISNIDNSKNFENVYNELDNIKAEVDNKINELSQNNSKMLNNITNRTEEILISNSATQNMQNTIDNKMQELIKTNNYTIENISKIRGFGLAVGLNDCQFLDVKYTSIDYAYNYLARDYSTIRVGYYEHAPYITRSEQYMQLIVRNAITDLKESTDKISSNLADLLISELNNKDTEFYKQVVCKNNCSDYNKIFYSNGEYYKVTIKHNTTEKYNEMKITKATTFESIAAGLYDTNIISGIQNNLNAEVSLLNKAMTCKASNCEIYNEVHFNAIKDEYLLVNVMPNNTYGVNQLIISKQASATDAIKNMYNIDSINASLESDTYLKSKISSIESENYYEIHYDGENYLLIKIVHDIDNSYNILTISKLWSPVESTENIETINMLIKDFNDGNVIYFFHVKDLNHLENNLIVYLEKYFEGIYYPYDAPELDGGPFFTGDYSINSIR